MANTPCSSRRLVAYWVCVVFFPGNAEIFVRFD